MDLSRCRNRTFQTLSRFGLTFDTPPGASALTGPTGFARMFRASQGSLYGISPQGLTATFRRPGGRVSGGSEDSLSRVRSLQLK